MRKSLFLLTIIVGFLSSCTTILKTTYGIKKPQVENKGTLIKYLTKTGIDTNNTLIPKDLKLFKKVAGEFGESIPEAVMFDSEGNRVTYKKTDQDCNAGLFSTIPSLTKNSKLRDEKGTNLTEFIQELVTMNNQDEVKNLPKSDYYLFISWAKYVGKLNQDHVKDWIDLVKANKNVKITVYKVNMDFQQVWGLELGKKM